MTKVLAGSLDLVTQSRIPLRNASLYFGLLGLITAGPVAVALIADAPNFDPVTFEGLSWGTILAGIVASLALIAINVDAQIIAVAILGGAKAGQPLTLREALRRSRQAFWPMFRAILLVGILSTILALILDAVLGGALGRTTDAAGVSSQLLVGLLTAPFVYAGAGVVLGNVQAMESLRRSARLSRRRLRLAVVVSLFAVVAQYLVILAAFAGIDLVVRALEPFHAQLENFDLSSISGFLLLTAGAPGRPVRLLDPDVHGQGPGCGDTSGGGLPWADRLLSRGLDGAREATEGEPARDTPAWISWLMVIGALLAGLFAAAAVYSVLTLEPRSFEAELLEPVVVDAEVVGELVDDRDPDLVGEVVRVREVLLEREPEQADLVRERGPGPRPRPFAAFPRTARRGPRPSRGLRSRVARRWRRPR